MVLNHLALGQVVNHLARFGRYAYWPTWVMTWPIPDLRLDFEIDLVRSKSTCVELSRRGEHDGVIFVFISFISKKWPMKNHIRENDNFSFDIWLPLDPNLLTLGQIWLEKVTGALRELFWIFPAYHTFGDNGDYLQKNTIFSNFDLWWPLVTSILT